MNIGIDLRCLQEKERTGVGEYAYELVQNILKQDRANRYFLFFNSLGKADIPKFDLPNATITRFRLPNKLLNICFLLFKYPKLDRLISKKFGLEKLDMFFSPNLNFVALSKNTKRVITLDDLSFEFFPEHFTIKQRIWHALARPKKQCQSADLIITPSENTRRDVIKYFNVSPGKVSVIYPGLSSIFTGTKQNINNLVSGKYLLFLGTIEPRKNILVLLAAFEKLAENFSDIKLVIAGARGWKNKQILKKVRASRYSDRIILPGYISDNDKKGLYENALAFIYPSLYEGFGFPVLEAMAAGVPVITSGRSSLPEITEGSALLIDPRRPEELYSAIKRLLDSQELHRDTTEKGLKLAKKFSWERAAKEWMSLTNS